MFDDAGRAAFIMSQVVCAQARIAGMIAENQHRVLCGNGIAYGEDAFNSVASEYQLGHNQVVEFLRAGR